MISTLSLKAKLEAKVYWLGRKKQSTVLNKLVLSLALHVENVSTVSVSDIGKKLVPSGGDPAAKGFAPSCSCVLLQS